MSMVFHSKDLLYVNICRFDLLVNAFIYKNESHVIVNNKLSSTTALLL